MKSARKPIKAVPPVEAERYRSLPLPALVATARERIERRRTLGYRDVALHYRDLEQLLDALEARG